jgi:RNA-directed DNA polymerase
MRFGKSFDNIPHSELLQSVARRIADGLRLHLLKIWLKAPVEERDEKGTASPLLATCT